MFDMRKLINLIEGAHTPPMYDPEDEEHFHTLAKTGFFGKEAAGLVFYAKSTKRFLLVKRSQGVEEPGYWGNNGGVLKASDNGPRGGAEREGREETGYAGEIDLVPLLVFKKPSFQYDNFLGVIEDEFVPDLGWEATDFEWCDFGDWPSPLHFGMVGLFNDAASVTKIKEIMDE